MYIYASHGDKVEIGTGFFINHHGEFATAYHVIKGAETADVYSSSKHRYRHVQLVGIDPGDDIAILTVNHSVPECFKLDPAVPKLGAKFTTIGHPQGFKDQTFQVRATQNGFANSMHLLDRQGEGIFAKEEPIIPLDLTIYNGMSGGPIINASGKVIGMISGSLNIGGSLAWGIPAQEILALELHASGHRSNLGGTPWPPMTGYTKYYRSFAITKGLSISETIAWLNKKWKEHGSREFYMKGFLTHLDSLSISYDKITNSLDIYTIMTYIGDEYREVVLVSLPDARRAWFSSSFNMGAGAFYVAIRCPLERSCISYNIAIRRGNDWKTMSRGHVSVLPLTAWAMIDEDGAERNATAINHLIALNNGPVPRHEAFGTR